MTLASGARLGPYEILSPLGSGGMGEVYRARDTKLGRDVALKVLPDACILDPDRLARFKREAQVLAALNHPNIGAIHGFEESNGVQALVLELVDGPTLADRIAQGPIPIDEALPIARQICEALEDAHEQGIIHRDVKPANIKLRSDGTVKVLDFGLAKLTESPAASGTSAALLSQSPTITSPAMTRRGVIIGTAGYMSPEQAKGLAADKRGDVWAFGCVLYEMLTGQRAFEAEDVSNTLVAVLRDEPRWTSLPDVTPASVRRLLHRCLEKNLKRRLHDIADARIEIDDASLANPTGSFAEPLAIAGRERRDRLAWSLAVILFVALLAAVIVPRTARDAPRAPVVRTSITLRDNAELDLDFRAYPLAVSPDGLRLVYVAENDGRKQLYLRELSDLKTTPIPGTTGAMHPFFSPDGAWVAFFARGMLQKVALRGGAPLEICEVSGISMSGSWGPDNTIVFATLDSGLSKVAATGGTPQPLPGSDHAAWPEILPDAKTVLFTSREREIATMSLSGGSRRILARADPEREQAGVAAIGAGQLGPVRFVPTGHLIFGHGNFRMRAVPFDLDSLTVRGSPVSIIDSVYRSADGGALYFAVSKTGVLVYAPEDPRRRLVWVERDGRPTPIGADQEAFRYPALSPDGRRVAVDINTEERRSDIWIYDVTRGTKTRMTSERSSILPLWNRDGTHLTFADDGIVVQAPQGSGKPEVLLKAERGSLYPTSWSPDGRTLLFTEDNLTTGMDLWTLPLAAGVPHKLLARRFNEWWGVFSRDGQWVAYMSDESGANEVYVAHYPDMEGRVIVSTHGGNWPVWSPDGRDLFYRQGNAVMAVPVETRPALRVGTPQRLFEGPYVGVDGDRKFDVAPDGRRFLMIERVDTAVSRELVVVQNWFEELKARAPAK